jgi:hypothetical protein
VLIRRAASEGHAYPLLGGCQEQSGTAKLAEAGRPTGQRPATAAIALTPLLGSRPVFHCACALFRAHKRPLAQRGRRTLRAFSVKARRIGASACGQGDDTNRSKRRKSLLIRNFSPRHGYVGAFDRCLASPRKRPAHAVCGLSEAAWDAHRPCVIACGCARIATPFGWGPEGRRA